MALLASGAAARVPRSETPPPAMSVVEQPGNAGAEPVGPPATDSSSASMEESPGRSANPSPPQPSGPAGADRAAGTLTPGATSGTTPADSSPGGSSMAPGVLAGTIPSSRPAGERPRSASSGVADPGVGTQSITKLPRTGPKLPALTLAGAICLSLGVLATGASWWLPVTARHRHRPVIAGSALVMAPERRAAMRRRIARRSQAPLA